MLIQVINKWIYEITEQLILSTAKSASPWCSLTSYPIRHAGSRYTGLYYDQEAEKYWSYKIINKHGHKGRRKG